MAHVTLEDGLAIWELIYYIAALICSIFVSFRHGLSRSSGWIFLTIFSTIRVINYSAQIATIATTSDTLETVITITGFLGLSPLLLATLGLLSRVYFDLIKRPYNIVFSLFLTKIIQVPAGIALILCIVGATSADSPADISNQATVKAGVIIYLVVFVALILLTMIANIVRCCMTEPRGERALLLVVTLSLPLLLVRIINSLLLIFSKRFQESSAEASTSAVLTELFMARVEEMLVVLLYLCAGLTQRAVPEGENGTRSNKEKLAYRTARGDFGGGKLGVISLVVALVSTRFGRSREQDQDQQDSEAELRQYHTAR
ncbi:hypothetical protein V8C35DRAFT_330025 [Trichoderma chlorosporum]